MQQYADIYLLLNYSTCFEGPLCPSSEVTVNVLIWSRLKKFAPHLVLSVPEAATTVLCTPDDGCDGCPKHVQ